MRQAPQSSFYEFDAQEIAPRVYLGSSGAAHADPAVLLGKGIRHILVCGRGLEMPYKDYGLTEHRDAGDAGQLGVGTGHSSAAATKVNEHPTQTGPAAPQENGRGDTAKPAFVYKQLKVIDLPVDKITPHFAPALLFIAQAHAAGSAVLIHCSRGVSRSVSISCAYLMHTKGMSYPDAIHHIRSMRAEAMPNAGFETELRAWDSQSEIELKS